MAQITFQLNKGIPYHADYMRDRTERAFYELSFNGGTRYKDGKDANGEEVFVEHEQESKKSSNRRKRLSVYRNYSQPIIKRYNNFIFGNSIRRDMDATFQDWTKDVDLLGNSLHQFMKKAVLQAQKFGKWFVQVETSKTQDYQTVAQAENAGNKVFLIDVHPDVVVNWTCIHGVCTEILIHDADKRKLCLYDAINYQEVTLNDKEKVVSIGAPTPHGFGALPILMVHANDESLSQIRDVAEVNKQLFYYDSLLAEELSKQTFTQAFLIDYDPDDEKRAFKSIGMGSRKYICIPPDIDGKNSPKLEKMSADVSQATSISSAISANIQEIYRLAGLYDFGSSAMGDRASGNSLQIKFNEVSLMAASICQQAERAENNIVDFYNRLTTSSIDHCDYPDADELDCESFTNELKSTLDIIGSTLPKVLKDEQIRSFAQIAFPHLDTQKHIELEKELQADDDEEEETEEDGEADDAENADDSQESPPANDAEQTDSK